jgi:pseudaminic acid synthase
MISSERVFIIAELSANHGHSLETAIQTVKAAKECGADAIKIQTYTADTITIDSDKEWFRINQGTIWDGTTLYKLYKDAYTPWEWHSAIKQEAERLGLVFFSTPFDYTAVDFLEKLQVPIYKIASFEMTDIPLIEYVAKKGKPIIMSTGISTVDEIDEVIQACYRVGNKSIYLLKCVSQYPALPEDMNLKTIPHMSEKFGLPVGLSDHTLGGEVAIAAVALGAKIIEKHFILDKNIGGPDSTFSMEPAAFKNMVSSIRMTEDAIGNVSYSLNDHAKSSRNFSRSLFVCENMKAGDLFTEQNIRSIRPGFGLHPKYLKRILGLKAACDIERGTPLQMKLVNSDKKDIEVQDE